MRKTTKRNPDVSRHATDTFTKGRYDLGKVPFRLYAKAWNLNVRWECLDESTQKQWWRTYYVCVKHYLYHGK